MRDPRMMHVAVGHSDIVDAIDTVDALVLWIPSCRLDFTMRETYIVTNTIEMDYMIT